MLRKTKNYEGLELLLTRMGVKYKQSQGKGVVSFLSLNYGEASGILLLLISLIVGLFIATFNILKNRGRDTGYTFTSLLVICFMG